ncbi:MAG: hypothetical protein CME72_11635 [Halomonadaceae bacterium]|nr:hypothetical protein [Halomonadaceae bacterium]
MKSTTIDPRCVLTPRAQRAYDAVQDGNSDAVQSFAEHLAEEGLLGAGSAELPIELTVGHLVERYIQTADGIAELKAWAMAVAEEPAANLAA